MNWDWLYLINALCAYISWRMAMNSFKEGYNFAGWANIFASALNGAIIAHHFI